MFVQLIWLPEAVQTESEEYLYFDVFTDMSQVSPDPE